MYELECFVYPRATNEGDITPLYTGPTRIRLKLQAVGVARFIDASIYRDTFPAIRIAILFFTIVFFIFIFFYFFFPQ